MIEQINWIQTKKQLPDDEIMVLANHPLLDEPVWLAYHLTDDNNKSAWFSADGTPIAPGIVLAWAHLPQGIYYSQFNNGKNGEIDN